MANPSTCLSAGIARPAPAKVRPVSVPAAAPTAASDSAPILRARYLGRHHHAGHGATPTTTLPSGTMENRSGSRTEVANQYGNPVPGNVRIGLVARNCACSRTFDSSVGVRGGGPRSGGTHRTSDSSSRNTRVFGTPKPPAGPFLSHGGTQMRSPGEVGTGEIAGRGVRLLLPLGR
jgi:hypothetical protein